jgi:hypothetical protein
MLHGLQLSPVSTRLQLILVKRRPSAPATPERQNQNQQHYSIPSLNLKNPAPQKPTSLLQRTHAQLHNPTKNIRHQNHKERRKQALLATLTSHSDSRDHRTASAAAKIGSPRGTGRQNAASHRLSEVPKPRHTEHRVTIKVARG